MKIKVHSKYKNIFLKLHTSNLNNLNINKNLELIDFNLPMQFTNKLNIITGISDKTASFLIINSGFTSKISKSCITKYKILILSDLNKYIVKNKLILGLSVKKIRIRNILKLKKNSSYRGLRHYLHLPVRGQRTCSNAKTRKKYKIN